MKKIIILALATYCVVLQAEGPGIWETIKSIDYAGWAKTSKEYAADYGVPALGGAVREVGQIAQSAPNIITYVADKTSQLATLTGIKTSKWAERYAEDGSQFSMAQHTAFYAGQAASIILFAKIFKGYVAPYLAPAFASEKLSQLPLKYWILLMATPEIIAQIQPWIVSEDEHEGV